MRKMLLIITAFILSTGLSAQTSPGKNLFEFDNNSTPRWSSFENIKAEKGKGAMENNGAKGHPSDALAPGETKVLMNVNGPGIINRIWVTINDRSPQMLRSLKLEMFWDGAATPAVSVPFGDFFGMGLGKTAAYRNSFFANSEGKSFQCFIPMPFKKGAKVQITNESGKRLSHIFFDINFESITTWNNNYLYFHSYWNRDTATTLARDFELLPFVKGKGRFLGVNIGINANPVYKDYWWGEGEVKMYLDGDKAFPTLAGTGSEDYIGTGWGQGLFYNDYAGCLLANKDSTGWAFYRYHIPDPIYFKTDCRVTMQQMGGNSKDKVIELQKQGVPMIPVAIDDLTKINPLYKRDSLVQLDTPGLPGGFANFYRSDDVSATAYFYLDKPNGMLPALQSLQVRTSRLKK
ncbi:MAG: glycoside hydrolase family 172 protein [Chitinophagaceae bacterium]